MRGEDRQAAMSLIRAVLAWRGGGWRVGEVVNNAAVMILGLEMIDGEMGYAMAKESMFHVEIATKWSTREI